MEIDTGFRAALTAAIEHALDENNKGASHLGCALYANGQLIVITTKEMHAEMEAIYIFHLLSNTTADDYCGERPYCRFGLGEGDQGWSYSNVKALY
jgi:hypothetical protein